MATKKKDTYMGINLVRKFDGTRFEFHSTYATKPNADKEARFMKSKGYHTRVIKSPLLIRRWRPDVQYVLYTG